MADEKEKPPPVPVSNPQPGDFVYVAFWRPDPWPGQPDRGFGDTVPAHVISVGPTLAVVTVSVSFPVHLAGAVELPPGVPLRITPLGWLYGTSEDAQRAAALLKNPNRP